MRIIFCGTPEYAVPSLKKLHALAPDHEIVGVVSQPDKPKGRSKVPTPPPVVEAALALGIPRERIFQPRSINKAEVLSALRELQPDILCVVAYGNILKAEALALGKHFPINAHASLLPKHRGAAPIQAAILAGDAETGVCIIKMEAALDAGPVLLRRAIPIEARDTGGTLHDKLAALSAECFVEALDKIARNDFVLEAQDEARATYAGKLEKKSGAIPWYLPADEIERLIRAMTPWPGAWARVETSVPRFGAKPALEDNSNAVRLRVAEAKIANWNQNDWEFPPAEPCGFSITRGTANDAYFLVQCGGSSFLSITRVQPEGKREMAVGEYMRGAGRPFQNGSQWSYPK
jgi:methionyl-tRNA formyltransferase